MFCQLLSPDSCDITRFARVSSECGYCGLPTVCEKTSRNVNGPFVAFPKSVRQYIVFHCCVIRYIIMSSRYTTESPQRGSVLKTGMKSSKSRRGSSRLSAGGKSKAHSRFSRAKNIEGDDSDSENDDTFPENNCNELRNSKSKMAGCDVPGYDGYLLLNTKNGRCLSTGQIESVFKKFIVQHDPDLTGISTRSIRPSYATMMFRGWLDGKIHGDMNEDQFLKHMAMMTNSSTEQLKSTYISIDRGDYEKTVKGMVAAFNDMVGKDDNNGDQTNTSDEEMQDINKNSNEGNSNSSTSLCKSFTNNETVHSKLQKDAMISKKKQKLGIASEQNAFSFFFRNRSCYSSGSLMDSVDRSNLRITVFEQHLYPLMYL